MQFKTIARKIAVSYHALSSIQWFYDLLHQKIRFPYSQISNPCSGRELRERKHTHVVRKAKGNYYILSYLSLSNKHPKIVCKTFVNFVDNLMIWLALTYNDFELVQFDTLSFRATCNLPSCCMRVVVHMNSLQIMISREIGRQLDKGMMLPFLWSMVWLCFQYTRFGKFSRIIEICDRVSCGMWGPSVFLNTTFYPFATCTLTINDSCVHLLACLY